MAVKHFADLNLTGHYLTDFILGSDELKAAGKLRYDPTGEKYYGFTTKETAFLTKLDESSLSVASALKLTNKVKLWGNDFDGTADVNGDITLGSGKKIYFGGTGYYIELVEGNLHTNVGLYSDTFISARGKDDSGSSGGGTDLDAVWASLKGNTDHWGTDKINKDHIPDIAQSKVTGLESDLSTINSAISAINALIPDAASASTNQLADKTFVEDFVNSSIATNTATFWGTFETAADLPTDNVKENDYAFVIVADSSGNPEYQRYKYTSTGWKFEYTLNNSSFTAAQWSAINSNITDTLVTKLNGIATNAQVNVLEAVNVNGNALPIDTSKAVNITFGTGTDNGTVEFCGTDYAVKGLAALAYKSSLAFSELTGKPTTLSGYGITDGVNKVSTSGDGNAVTAVGIATDGHTLTLTKGATFATTSDITDAVFVETETVTSGNAKEVSVPGTICGVSTRYQDAECICEVTYSNAYATATVTWGFTATSAKPMTINVFYKK